jgi:hypothetical protein
MGSTKRNLIVLLFLTIGLCSSGIAQNRYWNEIKGKPLVKFDWNCASPKTLPKSLSRLIETALKEEDAGPTYYADRAFAYDLDRDGNPEYFVPLDCGATGNCTFGLFALNPGRFLGKVNGEYIYLHGRRRAWPDLITYGHFSAVEGTLVTFTFRRGRYQEPGSYVRTDLRGGIYGKKVPAFLEGARPGCRRLGY